MPKYGTVFIARCEPRGYWPRDPRGPEYVGHWEHEEPSPHMVEEGPGWDDIDEAIAWGRARAPLVIVQLGSSEEDTYSAGERRATRELPEYGGTDLTPCPEWPPSDWEQRK
jgi:hypothetical protein